MKATTIAIALGIVAATATTGAAAEWHHATAPMGQFEGELRIADDNMISYGCAITSSVSFTIPGQRDGIAEVHVDGNVVRAVDLQPREEFGTTTAGFSVRPDDAKSALYGYNYLIHSMAEGGEVSLRQGDETLGTWTLAGSRKITNCAVFISH